MKKTWIIDLFQTIKKTKVSFISIVMFVGLSMSLYKGLGWSAEMLREAAVRYGDRFNLRDIEIIYPYGFGDEDIAKLSKVEGVSEIEAGYLAYQTAFVNNTKVELRVMQIGKKMNLLEVKEGTLPNKVGEIAIDIDFARDHDLKIGDSVSFEHDYTGDAKALKLLYNVDLDRSNVAKLIDTSDEQTPNMEYLVTSDFVITALVVDSQYAINDSHLYGVSMTSEAYLDGGAYICEESFNQEAYMGYVDIFVRSDDLRGLPYYSEQYKKLNNDLKSRIEDALDPIAKDKEAQLMSQRDKLIKVSSDELTDAQSKIEDGKQQIQERQKQLEDAQKQVKDGDAQIKEADQQIEEGKAQLAKEQLKLDEGSSKIEAARSEVEAGKEEFASKQAQLGDAQQLLHEKEQELEDGYAAYNAGKSEYEEGMERLQEAREELDNGHQRLEAGIAEYEAKSLELSQGKELVSQMIVIRNSISGLHDFETMLINDEINSDNYVEVVDNSGIIETLASVSDVINNHEEGLDPDMESYITAIKTSIDTLGSELIQTRELAVEGDSESVALHIATMKLVMMGIPELSPENLEAYIERLDQEIEEKNSMIAEGEVALADGKKQIDEASEELDRGEAAYDEGLKEAGSARQKLDDAWGQIEEGERLLNEKKQEINDAGAKLLEGRQALDEGIAQINAKEQEYLSGKNLFNIQKQKLEESEALLDSKKNELEDAKDEIKTKQDKLKDAIAKIDLAQKSYEEQVDRFNSFKGNSEKIDDQSVMVQTREYLIYLAMIKSLESIISEIKSRMALLFVIVGLFVSFSAITRLVNLSIKQIGTQKALGYKPTEIARLYVSYVSLAAILGNTIGAILITFGIEKVLAKVIAGTYELTPYRTYVNFGELALYLGASIVILSAIALLAIRGIVKKRAIQLLTGSDDHPSKHHFYEKFPVWRRLSVFNKTIVSNFLSDGRRVMGTVVGIAGCTSLVVSSLTLKTNIDDCIAKQFNQYEMYDYILLFENNSESTYEEIDKILNDNNLEALPIGYLYGLSDLPGQRMSNNNVIVIQDGTDFEPFIRPIDAKGDLITDLDHQVLMSIAFYEYYKKEGLNHLGVMLKDGTTKDVTFTDYYQSHTMSNRIIMRESQYQEIFGSDFVPNAFLVKSKTGSFDIAMGQINKVNGFEDAIDYEGYTLSSMTVISGLCSAIVVIYTGLAIIMSVLVILNLLVQFIDEKKNSLIILMINGYSTGHARRYIYMDTILQCILGTTIGIAIGSAIGVSTVAGFDNPMIHFERSVNPLSCIVGIVASFTLTLLMCLIAMKRISKFKLSDITK